MVFNQLVFLSVIFTVVLGQYNQPPQQVYTQPTTHRPVYTQPTTHRPVYTQPTTHRPVYTQPPTHRPVTHAPVYTQPPTHAPQTHAPTQPTRAPLYCYSCNENQPACSLPTLDLNRLNIEHYVPCNGQCMQYRNQWDNYKWYRGCSWEMDFGTGLGPQPSPLNHNGNTFYFCETNGCNIQDIRDPIPTTLATHRPVYTQPTPVFPIHSVTQPHWTAPIHNPYQKKVSKSNKKMNKTLYCFECNENLPACALSTMNITTLWSDHYVPCNGQCMQFQNPNDNYLWYRGCTSRVHFDNGNDRQNPVVVNKGILYYICESNGCNLGHIGRIYKP